MRQRTKKFNFKLYIMKSNLNNNINKIISVTHKKKIKKSLLPKALIKMIFHQNKINQMIVPLKIAIKILIICIFYYYYIYI